MTEASATHNILGLVMWFVVVFAISAVGAAASVDAGTFYGQLEQPAWSPPAWVFGPVWTALYALMAISAWLVWRSGGLRANRTAFVLFFVQLGLNALWSWLFFAWHLGAVALIEVLVLWAFILATLLAFRRVNAAAGYLLLPYLLWVGFAAVLNFTLWRMNPGLL